MFSLKLRKPTPEVKNQSKTIDQNDLGNAYEKFYGIDEANSVPVMKEFEKYQTMNNNQTRNKNLKSDSKMYSTADNDKRGHIKSRSGIYGLETQNNSVGNLKTIEHKKLNSNNTSENLINRNAKASSPYMLNNSMKEPTITYQGKRYESAKRATNNQTAELPRVSC